MTDARPGQNNPLLVFLDLCHRARAAVGSEELAFLAVNDTRRLVAYRQAALCFVGQGVVALSGVVQPEANAPYGHWLLKLQGHLLDTAADEQPRRLMAGDLPDELANEWTDWLPAHALWLPLAASVRHPGSTAGGLLLAGDAAWNDDELALLAEWRGAWQHAWLALFRPPRWSPRQWWRGFRGWLHGAGDGKWWRRRPLQLLLGALLVALFPVRLSVLAPGELVPANPVVIRAPLDGVIGQFHVQPNEAVKAGQALFSFDEASLTSRLAVSHQALATAEAEYRQFAQLALADSKSKGQLALLLGKIGERRAEAEFLAGQLERSRVVAPQDGIAIFDDPGEWIGKPVQTGERVMRVAAPQDVEIEAWVPIGDAIPLDGGVPVKLYLAASPFAAVTGELRYLNHDAVPRPDGNYAYRARARMADAGDRRVGLKGTAKLSGGWVPLVYWALRRPLAGIRQFLAW